jgi:hypothetical protein
MYLKTRLRFGERKLGGEKAYRGEKRIRQESGWVAVEKKGEKSGEMR